VKIRGGGDDASLILLQWSGSGERKEEGTKVFKSLIENPNGTDHKREKKTHLISEKKKGEDLLG